MNASESHPVGGLSEDGGRPILTGNAVEDDRKIREFAAGFKAVIFAPMIKKMASEMGPIAGMMEETFTSGFTKALAADATDPLYLQLRAQLKETPHATTEH